VLLKLYGCNRCLKPGVAGFYHPGFIVSLVRDGLLYLIVTVTDTKLNNLINKFSKFNKGCKTGTGRKNDRYGPGCILKTRQIVRINGV